MDVPGWIPGLTSPLRLRTGGNFEVYSARDEEGAPRVVLLASSKLAEGEAARRAQNLARVHDLVACEMIPRSCGTGSFKGRPYVLLDCPAVTDAEVLANALFDSGQRLPYAGAIGALLAIGGCLERAHRILDPETGRPCALGSLPLSGLLIDEEGSFWIIGFGDPNLARDGSLPTPFVAPELALGGEPTPATDIVALATLMRSTVPYIDLPPVLGRVLGGSARRTDAQIAAVVHGLNSQVWGLPPALRPSLSVARKTIGTMLRLLGVTPDATLLQHAIRERLLGEKTASPAPPPAEGALEVASDGSWLRLGAGRPVRLASRAALRRVLLCLIEAHKQGRPSVDVWELLEAGWPGENPPPAVGANRVYATIAALRRMGLRDHIERFEMGYRLTAGLRVERPQAQEPGA